MQSCVSAKVLTVVATKGALFKDGMLLSLIEIHGCCVGRCFLELQGRSLCACKTGIDTGKGGHSFVEKSVGPREDRAKIPVTQTWRFLSPNVLYLQQTVGQRADRPKIAVTKIAVSSVSTGDSASKRRQAQNNSHFCSCVLSPGPTVDRGTTKGKTHNNCHRGVSSLSMFLYLSLFSWQLFYLEMKQVVFL
jgi:hypothetical protein